MQEDHSQGLCQAWSVARLVEAPWYPVLPRDSECVFVKSIQSSVYKVKTEHLLLHVATCYLCCFAEASFRCFCLDCLWALASEHSQLRALQTHFDTLSFFRCSKCQILGETSPILQQKKGTAGTSRLVC